jgi:hypothetical protein
MMSLESSTGEPSIVDMVSSLNEPSQPAPETEVSPAAEPTSLPADPTPAEPTEPDPVNTLKTEVDDLKRIIASDPTLRQQYYQSRYGIAPVAPPQPQQQYSQPEPQPAPQQTAGGYESLFPEGYDPYNPEHAAKLLQAQLTPFASFIEEQRQQDAYAQQQQQQTQTQQQVANADKHMVELLDKQVPGYQAIVTMESGRTPEQKDYVALVENTLYRELGTRFPPRQDGSHLAFWLNPKVHQEVVSAISPQLKRYAQILGISSAPPAPATVNREMAREMAVESSNAVPVSTGNAFSQAAKKNDVAGMVAAIGYT